MVKRCEGSLGGYHRGALRTLLARKPIRAAKQWGLSRSAGDNSNETLLLCRSYTAEEIKLGGDYGVSYALNIGGKMALNTTDSIVFFDQDSSIGGTSIPVALANV